MIFYYLISINALTFWMFYWDKRMSRTGGWRVPENSLLTLSFLGGSPAAFLAMPFLRHKTKKGSFRVRFMLMFIVQVCTLYYLAIGGKLQSFLNF